MPYYHVYIDMDGDETEETDFSKEQLMEHIVRPYNQRKKFLCKGRIVYPADITTIRIIETEQPSSEIIPKMKTEKGLLGLFTNDFALLEERGREVTREFIITKRRRQKKKSSQRKGSTALSKNIFIVHGKDHEPVKELKTMLVEFGLNPVVLHEQASGGSSTLAEKLEKYAENVGYAFVILTPDDIGCQEDDLIKAFNLEGPFLSRNVYLLPAEVMQLQKRLKRRARQNVIFEMGYFWGMLERKRVCCLLKGDVEKPSDIDGILYLPFKESVNEARDMIVKELKAAGYEIVPEQPKKEKEDMEGNKSLRKEVEELKDYLDRRVD